MTMNQATAAAFFFAALASSSAASSSSHEELKDEIAIAPLLAYRPYHYLYRNRMRMSDECLEDIFNVVEAHPTLFVNASDACASKTVVGDTTIFDYDGCDLSNITEACTADNGKLCWTLVIIITFILLLYPTELIYEYLPIHIV
jgi:hypothetical protein